MKKLNIFLYTRIRQLFIDRYILYNLLKNIYEMNKYVVKNIIEINVNAILLNL